MTARLQWTAWLALEAEAVWTYPVIGARVAPRLEQATAAWQAHRRVQGQLLSRFERKGWPVPVQPAAYDIETVAGAADAERVAQSIESRITAACAALVGVTSGADRSFAVAAQRTAAVAAATWGAEPTALPGLRPSAR